ncbi:MAG TPA: protein translocase subunit SecF [Thermoanaerobacterales bacterium]|nr:protein translocase subunit SecF [Thermoanaerobacterales bacterium]
MKSYKIVENRKIWFVLSLVIILAGLFCLITNGLNWGIDFTGGSILQYNVNSSYDLKDVRQVLDTFNLSDYDTKKAGDNKQELIIRTVELDNDKQNEITNALKQKFPKLVLVRADKVDAVIGKELQRQAVLALIIANIGMLIYISFRFEFRSALAAIIALVHDVLVLISIFAIFRIPVDINFVAALLAIVGYSINDTIVIFDRVRENLKLMHKTAFSDVINESIAQTMSRTINTSLTTLIAVVTLFIFGGETIRDFTLALIVGITSGTYSSIFLACPLWAMFRGDPKTAKA